MLSHHDGLRSERTPFLLIVRYAGHRDERVTIIHTAVSPCARCLMASLKSLDISTPLIFLQMLFPTCPLANYLEIYFTFCLLKFFTMIIISHNYRLLFCNPGYKTQLILLKGLFSGLDQNLGLCNYQHNQGITSNPFVADPPVHVHIFHGSHQHIFCIHTSARSRISQKRTIEPQIFLLSLQTMILGVPELGSDTPFYSQFCYPFFIGILVVVVVIFS
jgi:hypothetical protein